jgi:hypothetical protein
MIMGYYRLGKQDDARRSMERILGFARRFRMDNNLTKFGSEPYQPNLPINCVYDTWGVPAAMIRGLFEYLYTADGLTILPHIPAGIARLEQRIPIRFGAKRLYLSTTGRGPVTGVLVNGRTWAQHDAVSVSLPYAQTPDEAIIEIALGGAAPALFTPRRPGAEPLPPAPSPEELATFAQGQDVATANRGKPGATQRMGEDHADLGERIAAMRAFHGRLVMAGLGDGYEAAHARLIVEYAAATIARSKLLAAGALPRLPEPSQLAADRSYVETVARLCDGLEKVLRSYETATDPVRRQIHRLWTASR